MPVFPSQLYIGSVSVSTATVLAPMAGVTDTVFRRFIRDLGGCGLLMTEFTSSHGVSARRRSGRQDRAAQILGISRRTLIRKLKAYSGQSLPAPEAVAC